MQDVDWIPIVMFVAMTVVACAGFWFRFRSRAEVQMTVRAALDKGNELSPELVDRLGHPKRPKDKDMRGGIIWLSIAVALVLIGLAVPGADALRGLLAGAALPLCIGIAYLILHRFSEPE